MTGLSGLPEESWIRRKTVVADNSATMRTMVDFGDHGRFVLDEPVTQGGTGEGPSPLQAVLGALCGCEAVTFRRTASDLQMDYQGLSFEGAYTIDIRGRLGDRSVRPHFKSMRLRVAVQTEATLEQLSRVIEETEARCPVMNLLLDAKVDLNVEWWRNSSAGVVLVPRHGA